MSVISCYNFERLGHIAKECRQRLSNELREHRSRADYGRQGTSFDSREPSSATRDACNVQKRNWIPSGNGYAGGDEQPVDSPCPETLGCDVSCRDNYESYKFSSN